MIGRSISSLSLLGLLLVISILTPASAQDAPRLGLNFIDENTYRSIPLANTPLLGNLPQSIDLSDDFPVPGNQGQQSSCVGWALSYLKTYQEKAERKWSLNAQNHNFSPAYIYNQIRLSKSSCEGGSNFVDGMNLLRREGAATLADFPYDETSCDALPNNFVKQTARQFSIADWRRVNPQDEIEIKTQVASGFPVAIGMTVDESFRHLHGPAIYTGPTAASIGGHAMVVVGYSDEKSAFKVINSWRTSWGDGGFGWISYAAFRQAVREAYVAQDIVPRPFSPTPAPAPTPGPTPTPVPPPAILVRLDQPVITHNIVVSTPTGMQQGMQISVPGQITGAAGRILQIVIKFNYLNGPPLQANFQEPRYRDSGGLVATGTQPIPVASNLEATDPLQISIPYYALNFQPTGGQAALSLSLTAIALVDNQQKAQTPGEPFVLRW